MAIKSAINISPDKLEAGDVMVVAVTCHIVKDHTGMAPNGLAYRIERCTFEGEDIPQGKIINSAHVEAVARSFFPVAVWAGCKPG